MKIYLASSRRNTFFERARDALREAGHEVFDFKHEDTLVWEAAEHQGTMAGAETDEVIEHFNADFDALRAAECTVICLPAGRSAHLELGYATGQGQLTFVYLPDGAVLDEPDLMYRMCDELVQGEAALLERLAEWEARVQSVMSGTLEY